MTTKIITSGTNGYYRHGEVFWRDLIARQPQSDQGVRKMCKRIARQLWEKVEILKHQIAQFTRARFGASSEQLIGQAELFIENVTLPTPPYRIRFERCREVRV